MRDYTNNHEDRMNFVRNFKIHNGEIIAKMGDKTKRKAPYTEDNEKKLLRRMNKQTENIKQIVNYFRNGFIGRAILTGGLVATTAASMVTFSELTPTINGITLLSGAATIIMTNKTRKFFNNLRDAERTEFFKENESLINKHVNTTPNVMAGVSLLRKFYNIFNKEEELVFNINTIDINKWSLNDLKQIRDNILVYQNLGLSEEGMKKPKKQAKEPEDIKQL